MAVSVVGDKVVEDIDPMPQGPREWVVGDIPAVGKIQRDARNGKAVSPKDGELNHEEH